MEPVVSSSVNVGHLRAALRELRRHIRDHAHEHAVLDLLGLLGERAHVVAGHTAQRAS